MITQRVFALTLSSATAEDSTTQQAIRLAFLLTNSVEANV